MDADAGKLAQVCNGLVSECVFLSQRIFLTLLLCRKKFEDGTEKNQNKSSINRINKIKYDKIIMN